MSGPPGPLRHRGQVVREDGTPVPGALVAVVRGTAPTPEIGIRADAAGRFAIALPPGRFVVQAHSTEHGRGTAALDVEGTPVAFRIVLSPRS